MPPRLAQPGSGGSTWTATSWRPHVTSGEQRKGVGKPKGTLDTLEDDIPGRIKERSEKCETIKQCREA